MSRTEDHVGQLTEVFPKEGQTLEELCFIILMDLGLVKQDYHKTVIECFEDELSKQYIIHKGRVFKIDSEEYEDGSDIAEAAINEDKTIRFRLKFYNGGTYFSEVLGQALDKLEL